jgi:hypothetical protein
VETLKFLIDSTGNVGIGKTNPYTSLQVNNANGYLFNSSAQATTIFGG